MFPLRIELRTFRVLSGCDNHYTTETLNVIDLNMDYKAKLLVDKPKSQTTIGLR